MWIATDLRRLAHCGGKAAAQCVHGLLCARRQERQPSELAQERPV